MNIFFFKKKLRNFEILKSYWQIKLKEQRKKKKEKYV